MSGLLVRSSLRHFRRHPLQAVLAVLGIALGVAVVIAIDLATTSARRAFAWSSAAVAGGATHEVVGSGAGLPDSAYRIVRVDLGLEAAPVVDASVTLRGPAGAQPARLLGLDPFAEAPFRSWLDASQVDVDLSILFTSPGALLLTRELATALGVAPGDTLHVVVAGVERTAWLAGTLAAADPLSRRALADVALSDVAAAQELTGRVGRLDRLELRLPADSADAAAARIVAALPYANVVATTSRSAATLGMTRSFELNLTAFSLITLLFGALLIYDTMTFSVVQRRERIGLLRAIGVTRREVLALFLAEAGIMGVLGTLLGIVLGAVLARSLLGLVTGTLNDLYFAVSVTDVRVAPASLVRAVLLGLGATLVAAFAPVREATSTPPRRVLLRSHLEERTRRRLRAAVLTGLLLLVLGFLLVVSSDDLVAGFAALFAVVFAAALLSPLGAVVLAHVLRPAAARLFGLSGAMAVRGMVAALSRTGPAVAALMVAVAVGAAVALMVSSFRGSVERWLDRSLEADVYVSVPSGGRGSEAGVLRPDVLAALESAPGVQGATRYRNIDVPRGAGTLRLVAIDLFPRHRASFTFLDRDSASVWPVFDAGGLLVSQSLAWREDLEAGDTLVLRTARGPHAFPVAGVYRDYSSEFGVAFLPGEVYRAWWGDDAVTSIALWLEPGRDADALIGELRRATEAQQALRFRSNRGLRDATLEVFDRTFLITRVLRALALIVAFFGVLATLMALQLERGRELAVLRAAGFTPGQVRGLVLAQSGLIGLTAGLLALPVAVLLGWLLIHVVNRRAFGWTIDLRLDGAGLAQAVLLAVAAALLAGLGPARQLARTPPGAALRDE